MLVRRMAIGSAVVLALVAVGDQGLRAAAEHRLARQTSCRLHAVHSSVGIGGPLLVPQIVRNRYRHITIHSQGLREPGGAVNLNADLYEVRQVGHSRLYAGHGEVSVVVPFATIGAAAGKDVSASEADGQLLFTSTDTADGTQGSTVYAAVALEADTVVVTPVRVMLAGKQVPWAQARRTAARTGQSLAQRRVRLPALLTSLGLTSATATPAGLVLEASGPGLTLTIPNVPGC